MRSASAWLSFLLLCGCTEKAHIAAGITKLDSPSNLILYSLDSGPLQHDESIQSETVFHGYDILGRADISDADERRALVRALARSARESDGSIGACFNPRHGLHVEQSGCSVDFVICFECLQVHAHESKSLLAGSQRPGVNRIIDAAVRRIFAGSDRAARGKD
jgi:hypothetical protein